MTEEPLDLASLEARPYFGVWAPALTPVDKELRADIHRYATHARWLLHNGCHRIVVFGTTGEAPSFSVAERSSALEGLLKAGLSPQHLVVGTGCAALTDTVTLTKHAVGLRCNTVLMLPPFYFKGSTEEGLFRSYAEIIERVGSSDLNVVLYHFPRMSAVPITPELLRRLCHIGGSANAADATCI